MAGSIAELSKYRYKRALEELKNAKEVFMAGSYKLALNFPRLCRMLWKCVNMQIMMTFLWLPKRMRKSR